MEKVGSYPTVQKAEAAGEMLIRYGISPKLEDTTLWVEPEDAQKAITLLGIADEEEERQRTEPFHPCPSCSTPDPIWFGKRKIFLFLGIFIGAIVVAQYARISSVAVIAIAFAILIFGFYLIPEYECRRCGNRWTREPRRPPAE